MKRLESIRQEHGQTLVWVALALVALLAFVGLAIDGGAVYSARRQMQNAADAGALAGAREICFGTAANAQTVALNYAETNQAVRALTAVTVAGGRVDVTARTEYSTSFMRLLGVTSIPVPAHAAARCGKATQACGLWPLTFSKGVWDANQTCNKKFLLWEDGRANCTDWNCDVDNDGIAETLALDDRAWADFTAVIVGGQGDQCDSNGCSNAELNDRILGQTNGGQACRSMIALDQCMVGDSGVRSSSWADIEQVVGKIRSFPLYSSTGCTVTSGADGTCGNERYFISDFACIRVEDTCKLQAFGTPNNCDQQTGNGPRVVVVSIPCDANGQPPPECATECGRAGDEIPLPGDIKAVSLIE